MHLVIENRSGVLISSSSVTAGGREIRFPPIPFPESADRPCWIRGNVDLLLSGKLADGTDLDARLDFAGPDNDQSEARFIVEAGGKIWYSRTTKFADVESDLSVAGGTRIEVIIPTDS